MEFISFNLHLVECRYKQDVYRTSVVNQDHLYIEIGDGNRYDYGIIMGKMHASQIVVGEGYWLMSSSCR